MAEAAAASAAALPQDTSVPAAESGLTCGGPVRQLLGNMTVDDLASSRPIQELASTATLQEGILLLFREDVHSSPVYCQEDQKYLGFVDVADCVALAVQDWRKGSGVDRQFRTILPAYLSTKSLQRAVDKSHRDPFVAVPKGTSLLEVAELLAQGLKRVAVVNAEDRVVQIVSQSDIVRLFSTKLGELPEANAIRVVDVVPSHQEEMALVTTRATAMEAFERMAALGSEAVGITEEVSGEVVTAITCSDIRILSKLDNFPLLNLPAVEFVSHVRLMPHTTQAHSFRDYPAVIWSDSDSTLAQVAAKLAATRVHQVFVSKGQGRKPLRVITVRDVLSGFLKEA